MIDSDSLVTLGFVLFLMGFVAVFVSIVLMLFSSADGEKEVRGGGAVIIGPFPIVFGTDVKSVKVLLVLSVVLIALTLLISVIFQYL